jgi:hypothetical protein
LFFAPAAMAGMITLPQFLESPETAKFHDAVDCLFCPWAVRKHAMQAIKRSLCTRIAMIRSM